MDISSAWSARSLSRKIILWLALAGLILAGISGLILHSVTELMRSGEWVAQSYRVLDALENTQTLFLDAESAERGFVATCRPSMLVPFRNDLPKIFGRLAVLQALTRDDEGQRAKVEQLSNIITAELGRMSTTIRTTEQQGQKAGEAMLADQQNAAAPRQIIGLLTDMEQEERSVLTGRLQQVQKSARMTLAACAAGVAAVIAILIFVFWIVRRETRKRELSEASLQRSNTRLEGSLSELRHYNETSRTVSLLGELLQTCRNVDEATTIAARHLSQMLPRTAVSVALFNPARDGVNVACAIGEDALFSPQFSPGDCWGLRRGRPHLTQTGSVEPPCDHIAAGGETVLCLPMIAQGETLGILSLTRSETFSDHERAGIQTIAEQLSLALANLQLQERLRNQSLRDPLTGLFNRRHLDDTITREVARAIRHNAPLSVAMIDIDHFKRFNDTQGHEGGDALLAAFGTLLMQNARTEDIVCRYGGEEFAVILPGASLETAAKRLDAIRAACARLKVTLHGQPLAAVTLSAGVACLPEDGNSGASLLASADAALYDAKKAGRNRVLTTRDMATLAAS